jgi:hypothetical protein
LCVDDTSCAVEKKKVEWAHKKIEEMIKIIRLRRLKKHWSTCMIGSKTRQGKPI